MTPSIEGNNTPFFSHSEPGARCQFTFSEGGGSFQNTTILSSTPFRVNDGSWDYTNTTIISDQELSFSQRTTLDNSTLVSVERNIHFKTAPLNATNSRIFGETDVTFSHALIMHGETTVATSRSLNLRGGTADSLDGVSRGALIAGGDITTNSINGFVSIVAGGDITFKEKNDIRGGISARNNISFSNPSTIDSGMEIDNPYLPGSESPAAGAGKLVIDGRR